MRVCDLANHLIIETHAPRVSLAFAAALLQSRRAAG